jgi:hypothetical protein
VVSQAIAGGNVQAINYFLGIKYVDALKAVASAPNQKVILMPLEAANVIGALGGIAELARDALQSRGGGAAPGPWQQPGGTPRT